MGATGGWVGWWERVWSFGRRILCGYVAFPGPTSHIGEVGGGQEEEEVFCEETWLLEDCPDDLICPLSLGLLEDPVLAMDGITYSRKSIEQHIDWCASKGKPLFSPMTNEPMDGALLVPIVLVRRMVSEYAQEKRKQLEASKAGREV